MRGIQYAAASPFITGVSGILDRPPELVIGRRDAPTRWRTMTAEGVALLAMTARYGFAISRREASEL
jgi:hypothetical protein